MNNSIFPCTRDYLTSLSNICQKKALVLPGKRLHINRTRGKLSFNIYEQCPDKTFHRHYLSANSPELLELISKYCSEKILAVLRTTSWKNNVASPEAFDKLDKISVALEDLFNELCPDYVRSRRRILTSWQNEPYKRNSYELNPNTNFVTTRGEIVRSKTELIIADILYQFGIPYRIEYPVNISGKTVYPDFMFVIPTTGKIYYLEAFGLMGDTEYVEKNIRKIRDYAKCGIIFGTNLIATFESETTPFDPEAFRRTILALMQE